MFKTAHYIKTVVNKDKMENAYSRLFYRRISPYITYFFLKLGISATTTTGLSVMSALIGCFLISFSDMTLTLIGLGCIQLWYLLDHVDGEIARLTKTTSIEGKYLDVMMHNFIHPIIYFSYALDAANNLPANYTDPLFAITFPARRALLFAGFAAGLCALIIDLSSTVRYAVILGTAAVEKMSGGYVMLKLKLRDTHPVGDSSRKMKVWHAVWYILCIPGAVIFLTIGSLLRINHILIPIYALLLAPLSMFSIRVRLKSKLDTLY